jgi:SPP1 gp7 family putative phage head morphogenesis protein
MPLDLPRMARARGIRRDITLRPIASTKAQAASLAEILLRPVSLWQQAIPRVMAGYNPPARAGDALTTDALSDITAALEAVSGEVERFLVTITAQLGNWSMGMERWQRGRWIAAVNGGTGVDLTGFLSTGPVQETLQEFLDWNASLVRDVSDQIRSRISSAVFAGWQEGKPPRELAKDLGDAVGLGRDRAKRIAADQSAKLAARLNDERQAEAGIDLVKWRSSHKLNFRPHHAARDGKIYELQTHKAVDGSETVPRGDWVGQQPYCGCTSQAYIPFLEGIE